MPLFTDCAIITPEDLLSTDPSVASIASSDTKNPINLLTICEESIESVGNLLVSSFQSLAYNFQCGPSSAIYLGAAYADQTPPARITLDQVVTQDDTTTFSSPLKRFCIFTALRNFYELASGRKDPRTDKYENRVKNLDQDLRNKYWRNFKSAGLPIVHDPCWAPAAAYMPGTGSFSASNVIAGDGLTWDNATEEWDQEGAVFESTQAGTYDVVVTWTRNDGVESYQSPTVTVPVLAGQILNVDIASLVPPTGVVSWNIYAGNQNGTLFFQANIPVSIPFFAFTASPATSGRVAGLGQPKDVSLVFIQPFFRG